jgi:two-component system chemotaxis response regulator CheB
MPNSARLAVPGPKSAGADPIRILIVDDSLVARTVLARILGSRPEFVIAGSVANAVQALELVRREPMDIILLDLEMPGVGGLEALPQLIEHSDGARVLVVSSMAADGAAATVQALALGAADTLQKPSVANFDGRFGDTLADRLIRIAAGRRQRLRYESIVTRSAGAATRAPIDCLAIGASTGGLHALTELLRDFPAEFTAPILITQHLPAAFMPYFADQMRGIAGRPATVARDGEKLVPGHILIAPGEGHIRLKRIGLDVRVVLDATPSVTLCMPSVDPMFESLAEVYGERGLAVVLSGMGRDGTIGAKAVFEAGGEILVQDAPTSVVWGMPGSVAEAGIASAIMPPARIADRILVRAGESKWS